MTASRIARFGTLAAALVLFALPSCIKAKAKVALGKDGSGTITETDTLDMSKMGELAEMMKGMGGGGGGPGGPGGPGDGKAGGEDPFKELDEESNPDSIKKKLAGKKGIELLSATRSEDTEKKTRTSERKIKFATFEDYYRCGLTKSLDVQLESVDGAWKLTQNMTMPGGDAGGAEAEQMATMMKPMLEPFLGEMEMNFSIDLPGTVVETNGTKNDAGTGVTWKMGFADLFDAKKRSFTVTFKGEGLTLKPFHLVIDEKGVAGDPKAKPATDPKDAPKEPEAPKEPAVPDAPK